MGRILRWRSLQLCQSLVNGLYLLVDVHGLLHTTSLAYLHSQNNYKNQKALQETLPSLGLPIFGLRFYLSKTLQTFSVSYKPRWRISSFVSILVTCLLLSQTPSNVDTPRKSHLFLAMFHKHRKAAQEITNSEVNLGLWSDRIPSREFLYDVM